MKIVVCVKWVGALGDDVEFTDDERHVDPDYLDYSLSEWDTCAVAEALRLRDAAARGGEVVVVTVGDSESNDALVRALAMGADRAMRVDADQAELLDSLSVGWLLAAAVRPERPDLVLCGAQSSDASQGSTGTALAALLEWPCAPVATRIDHGDASKHATVWSEHEGGMLDVLELELPAVITVQTGIIEPAYVTMRALLQARQADIAVLEDAPPGDPGYQIRRLVIPQRLQAELIDGGAEAVAARITELVRAVAP